MNLEALMVRFRALAKDTVDPYLFSDADVADWLTEGEAQACLRGRLLLDDYTPAVCQIPVLPGAASHKLHPKLYEIVALRFVQFGRTDSVPLRLVTREWLDRSVWNWRDVTDWGRCSRDRRYAIQSETGLRLAPAPDVAGVLHIEGYRFPLKPLANDTDKPEIHEAGHEKLVQWALFRAFSVPDSETFDPQRSAKAEAEFTRYFGLPVDSDLRRATREDEVQHVVAYWP